MCILVNLWWHFLILEKFAARHMFIGWYSWQIWSNKLDILHDAACWFGLVYAGSVSGISASGCDNYRKASWHACYKALHAFYKDFCPFIQQGMAKLTTILGLVVHPGDCMAQFIPNMFYGVAVWLSCRLLHLSDVALLKGMKDYPSTMMFGVIVLVAVIPEMLSGKWL